MKPATAARNRLRDPNLSASQPVTGVATAPAMMKLVSTQVTESCEAFRLVYMCGMATFAMVASRNWMKDAPITAKIKSPRWRVCKAAPLCTASLATMAGRVDSYLGRQPGDQSARDRSVNRDADRNALGHLYPIAAGILRREYRKFRTRARADGPDMACHLQIGIGVKLDLDVLAQGHAIEVGFLEIGFDPRPVADDDGNGGQAAYHHLTGLPG